MKRLLTGTVAACALSMLGTGVAHAEESPTAGHPSAAAVLGYGFKDGVGLGFGVRGGYTLPQNVYVGGTFVYHLGKSESTPVGDASVHLYYFGVEGGYDINVAPVVVRPYVGLGAATATASIPGGNFGGVTVPSQSSSDTKFGVWPGVTAIYPIGNAFVGADARFLIVSDFNAFSLFATGGMQF